MIVGRPMMIIASMTAVGPCITRSPYALRVLLKLLDFACELRGLVGDDPLYRLEPVLDSAKLGAELRILVREQLHPFHRLSVRRGIDRLTPGAVERIAVLDAKPGVKDPSPTQTAVMAAIQGSVSIIIPSFSTAYPLFCSA